MKAKREIRSFQRMYEGLVFANETVEWVYIFVPRCGSRSFRACGLFEGRGYPYAWKPKYEKYKKVALIRNPIDRVVSGFESGTRTNLYRLLGSIYNRYFRVRLSQTLLATRRLLIWIDLK